MHKPDGLVGDDVREALDWDNAIDDARIMVQVKDGKVTLSGAVHTYTEALKALEDTKHVKGVRDIDNQVLVGPAGEAVTDAVLLEACEKALDGNPFVPKGAVSVAARTAGSPSPETCGTTTSAMPPRTRSAGSRA